MKISNDLRIFFLSVLNLIAVCSVVLTIVWEGQFYPWYVYCLHCGYYVPLHYHGLCLPSF